MDGTEAVDGQKARPRKRKGPPEGKSFSSSIKQDYLRFATLRLVVFFAAFFTVFLAAFFTVFLAVFFATRFFGAAFFTTFFTVFFAAFFFAAIGIAIDYD